MSSQVYLCYYKSECMWQRNQGTPLLNYAAAGPEHGICLSAHPYLT